MPPQPTGYRPIEQRVIAPIPDKAQRLQQAFVRAVHDRGLDVLRSPDHVIAIGYAFNPLDRISYGHLLQAVSQGRQSRIVLVSPDAESLRSRLMAAYPGIDWVGVAMTLKEWVDAGFPIELVTG